ncbi:hypothetical protein N8990_05270 [Candidatus Pelagibacter sp.]|nr:hypothetical protein [Candidatus Pelagibacter sp.]
MAYTTIKKPSDYFNTKLYTGNGTDNHGITGVGFQPDFTWIKPRNEARGHALFDAVRGATKMIISNESSAEGTYATSLKSFDSDGFNLGTSNDVNKSSNTHVAWNWLANGAGVANTDGSISSTVSANTTSGFSIVKWIGTGSAGTIGHGLNAEAQVIIVKKLNSSESWFSYHKPLGNTGRLVLSTNDAVANDAGYWNSTTPTNQVFYVTSNGSNNASNDTYIAYCFADVQGYSKVGGSYVGNGNADGTFVYTGFKPAFIIVKPTSGAEHWTMFDNKRLGYNPDNNQLYPNLNSPDATADELDILSNGFKIRSTTGRLNTSGVSHIYMTFAEEPLVGDNPATAR